MPLTQMRIISAYLITSLLLIAPCQYALSEQLNTVRSETVSTTNPVPEPETPVEQKNIQLSTNSSQNTLTERITVTKSLVPLRSQLRKRYSGYKITLQNNSDVPLEIVSANVVMGTDGQQAYLAVKKGSKGGVAGILGGGLAVGLVTFGVGFALALIAAPIYWGVRHSKNKKAKQEGFPFTNQPPIGVFNPGDEVSMTTLIPFGNQAFIETTLKNTKTGTLFTLAQ